MGTWEYSPAPESTDVVSIADTYGLYIGGGHHDPLSGEYAKTINPATEEVLAAVAVAGRDDVARAVDIPLAVAHLRYYAGWPTKIEGEVIPVAWPNVHVYTRKEPVGVCGQDAMNSRAASLVS